MGFDDQVSLGKRESGGRVAAPIWLAFMQKALQGQPVTDFPIPPGIRFVRQAVQDETNAITRTPEGDPYFEVFIDPAHATSTASLINGAVTTVSPAPRRRCRTDVPPDAQSTGSPASGY